MRARLLTTGIVALMIAGMVAICPAGGQASTSARPLLNELPPPPPTYTTAALRTGTIYGTTKSCLIGTSQCYTGETTVCSASCMYVGDEVELDTRSGRRVLTAPVNNSHFTLRVKPGFYRVVVLFRSLSHPRHGKGRPYGPGHRVNSLTQPVTAIVTVGHTTRVTLRVIQPALG